MDSTYAPGLQVASLGVLDSVDSTPAMGGGQAHALDNMVFGVPR